MNRNPLSEGGRSKPRAGAWVGTAVPCNLCGSERHELLSTRGRHNQILDTVICLRCALVFTNPMPTAEEIFDFYRYAYRQQYKHVSTPKTKHVYRAGTRAVERYRQIQDLMAESSRVLDIGSGGGEFLHLLQRLGLDAHGIEPNLGYGQFSCDEYDLRVQITPMESASFGSGAFDLVTADHVIEHLRAPLSALRQIWGWLRPAGHAVIEVPNVEARYHSPKNRFHLAHLFHFCPETLEAMGRQSGFEVIETTLAYGTQHVRTVFRKVAGSSEIAAQPAVVDRVRRSIKSHTSRAHAMSVHPYRRLVGNLLRPLRERVAIPRAESPRQLLDRIYVSYVGNEPVG